MFKTATKHSFNVKCGIKKLFFPNQLPIILRELHCVRWNLQEPLLKTMFQNGPKFGVCQRYVQEGVQKQNIGHLSDHYYASSAMYMWAYIPNNHCL